MRVVLLKQRCASFSWLFCGPVDAVLVVSLGCWFVPCPVDPLGLVYVLRMAASSGGFGFLVRLVVLLRLF